MAVLTAAIALCSCKTTKGHPADAVIGRPTANVSARSVANLWYRIELDSNELDVGVRLYAPPDTTLFFLPADWAGRDDYGDAIGIAGARTNRGTADISIDRQAGELRVASDDAEWVEIRYRVKLAPRSDFHAQLDRGVLVAFGPTFLVTPSQQILEQTTQIPIEVWLPEGWTTASTWNADRVEPSRSSPGKYIHAFVARDVRELRDAFLVAGETLRSETFGTGSERVEVAFGPAFEGDTTEFAAGVDRIVGHFRKVFGEAGTVTAYVRARKSVDDQLGGLGRRGGFVIDVPTDQPFSEEARLLVAHEALHLWNGHILVPAADHESQTRWFKEGVTHYLALKRMAATGELEEEFVLRELSSIASNYRRNPVRVGASSTPVDEARFPYDFGVLVALSLDAALTSVGRVSIERWLVELLANHNGRYDDEELLQALQAAAGPEARKLVADVWRRFIRAREPIVLGELFDSVDLHWLPPMPGREARLMPLDRDTHRYRKILGLEPRND